MAAPDSGAAMPPSAVPPSAALSAPARPETGPLPFEIDPPALAAMRREGGAVAVLDVREPWEVEICALPDSLHVPLGTLPARLAELPADRPLVVVCHHGARSARATAWLRARGFDRAVNLAGGVDLWALSVDPGMRRY